MAKRKDKIPRCGCEQSTHYERALNGLAERPVFGMYDRIQEILDEVETEEEYGRRS